MSAGVARSMDSDGGELDLAALGRALWARKLWILVPTVVATFAALIHVNVATPVYRAETRLLVESGENAFTRPEGDRSAGADRAAVDQEAVASQVQLILSRDIARQAANRLELGRRTEFDPAARGIGVARYVLSFTGLFEDPLRMTAEERVMRAYFERLTAYQVDKSRVIAIQFESADPELAARAANAIAEIVIEAQQQTKRAQSRQASGWLATEVDAARRRVEDAEGRVESFRARANLFVGTNNTSLTAQQLAEVNSQIAAARAQQADAQTRARLLRDALRAGRSIEAGDVVNSEIMRRLNEQRGAVRAQLAELASTLGPRHPRIGELRSQLVDLDLQLRTEAEKLVRVLESDARLAGARVESLSQNLDQAKRSAGQAGEQEVQLRVLEREAKAQRDALELLLTRFRDVTARETLQTVPADARVISRAMASNVPSFPKKVPTVLIAVLGTLLLCVGCVTTVALLGGQATRSRSHEVLEPSHAVEDSGPKTPIVAETATEAAPTIAPAVSPPNALSIQAGAAHGVGDLLARLDADLPNGGVALIVSLDAAVTATGVTLALGRRIAADGRKVVMLDMNAAAPRLSTMVRKDAPGLTEVLSRKVRLAEILHRDPQSRAHVAPFGCEARDAQSILADRRLPGVVKALSRTYDVVLVAAGHGALAPKTAMALPMIASSSVLVAEANASDGAVVAAARLLERVGLPMPLLMVPRRDVTEGVPERRPEGRAA